MEKYLNLSRKVHFIGSKIRFLRKKSGLTLEDLSFRCIQVNNRIAPSVSYISLIETGKRIPSQELLHLFGEIFQKNINWFLDDTILPKKIREKAYKKNIFFEPKFLFSNDILETTIPELLLQTGTSGRQFTQILIRSYQEQHYNRFPDIERVAEEIGKKKFPLNVDDIFKLYKKHGLQIKWFDRKPFATRDDSDHEIKTMFRSFFQSSSTVILNRQLQNKPTRLIYDLAYYLAHKILHGGDGIVSSHATGGVLGGSPKPDNQIEETVSQEEILIAWRDFECSYYAGAMLCPRQPFRYFLDRESYDISSATKINLTPAVLMRRMTSVSPYKYWHYFDAFSPGYLRAVYRGNGFPLPWGNMKFGSDFCREWPVFSLIDNPYIQKPIPQLSLLISDEKINLYSSISLCEKDAALNPHVISTGIDLMPALENQGINAIKMCNELKNTWLDNPKATLANDKVISSVSLVSKILNIRWVSESLEYPIKIICPKSSNCPQSNKCNTKKKRMKKVSWLNEIKKEILMELKMGK